MEIKQNLQYKIELWNKLTDILNDKKSSERAAGNLFVGIGLILSTVNLVFDHLDNSITQRIMNLVYLIGPAVIVAVLFWFSMYNRNVAIMEGHLAAIEDLINEEMGECIYQTNSYFHWMKAKEWFPSNNYLFIFYSIMIVIVTGVCNLRIYKRAIIPLWLEIIYMCILIGFTVILLKELNTNAEMRKLARALYHDNYGKQELREAYNQFDDSTRLREFLCYEPDIKKIHDKYGVNNN